MQLIHAPSPVPSGGFKVFLSGSIQSGANPPWQVALAEALADTPCIFMHPGRPDWGEGWGTRADDAGFAEQVAWELRGMEEADVVVQYYAPEKESPISLLELGLNAHSGKLIVCCPEGFWKKGHVDLVCRQYGVPQAADLASLILKLRERIPQPSPAGK